MTTNVKVFKSTDTGAPGLAGQAGSLIALLDAVLVNGYNSGSVTSITRSGSTATVTRAGHGFQNGDCVLIEGADQAEYNGEFYISNVATDTFDFTVSGTPATPATGTITAKRAPAGWLKSFSGTNKAVYRQGGGNQFYLRVDDAGTTTARVVGYEAMTDVDTGTAPFPTGAQISGGLYFLKSDTANSTVREWVITAIDRLFHFLVRVSATNSTQVVGHCFGDIKTHKSGDAYHTCIIGLTGTNYTSNKYADISLVNSTVSGHYLARSYTQLGSSAPCGKHSDNAKINDSVAGKSGLLFPNPVDGGLYLAPLWLHEVNALRGLLPGVWAPLHAQPLTHWDTFEGAGALAGKTFLAWNQYNSGQVFLETSNTWDL